MRRTRTPRPRSSSRATFGFPPSVWRMYHGVADADAAADAELFRGGGAGIGSASPSSAPPLLPVLDDPSADDSSLGAAAGGAGLSHGSYFFRSSSERTRR